MENPREIDMDLVDAQQARRVLDRMVGYSVSPLLWKKVKRGLSAGRVQTAALADRGRSRARDRCVRSGRILVAGCLSARRRRLETDADVQGGLHRIGTSKAELKTEEQTNAVVRDLDGATYRVASVTKRESQRRPSAPFTTSTLQQEASRKLGYNVRRTMQLAQELYEGIDLGADGTQGLITYMRTDSTNVSAVAQQAARAVISVKFGT